MVLMMWMLLLLGSRNVTELLDFFDLLDLLLDEACKIGGLAVIVEKAFLGQAVLGTLRLAMYPLAGFGELNL